MQLEFEESLKIKYPGLHALLGTIDDVKITRTAKALEELKQEILRETKSKYTLESLKDVQIFRAYRDFFWKAGIDPTKVRPAAEALIRRILANKQIPTINTLVDAYNLASIKTCIALAAFDREELNGDLFMRAAKNGEEFMGIGMGKPMLLNGGEIVIQDYEKLIAVYPYRDADVSKVTEQTRSIILMVCGCPSIDERLLLEAQQVATDFIIKHCQGKIN